MLARCALCKIFFSLVFSSFLLIFLVACGTEQSSQTATESAPASASTMPAGAPVAELQAALTPQPPSQQERAERPRALIIAALRLYRTELCTALDHKGPVFRLLRLRGGELHAAPPHSATAAGPRTLSTPC